jgi:hypothetical protein
MKTKLFDPVWVPGVPSAENLKERLNNHSQFQKLTYDTIDELEQKIKKMGFIDVSELLLWDETETHKIYIFKFNKDESTNLIKIFFLQLNRNNIHNKKIIFINPTETCASDFEDIYTNDNYTFVIPYMWHEVGTRLYSKSMYDGLVVYQWEKFQKILQQNYRPFLLSHLVRRGHARRYDFFKKMHSFQNKNFLVNYFNANLTAKGERDETKELEFYERDGIQFPYSSHEVIEPVKFHAQFSGSQFMFTNICLLSMSKFNLVVESNTGTAGVFTEKSLFPFITKTIPILVNGINHINFLEKMGFHTFVDELGIREAQYNSYNPGNENNDVYYKPYFDLLDRINNGEFDNFYETQLDKLEHNYKLALDIQAGNFEY